jgi:hypothetical protein
MKFIENDVFVTALYKSPLLKPFAKALSIIIPSLELLIAISLLTPLTRKLGLYSFLGMMSIFTIYIGFMLYFRSERPCTCGGIIKYMNWHQHLYFNSGFALLAILGIWLENKIQKNNSKGVSKLSYNS